MRVGSLRLRHDSPDQAGRSGSAGMDTRVAAGGTPIRRYALALAPAGAGVEAAATAASVPPLSGGAGSHGSGAAHAFTLADSVAEPAASPPSTGCRPIRLVVFSASDAISLYCHQMITVRELSWPCAKRAPRGMSGSFL